MLGGCRCALHSLWLLQGGSVGAEHFEGVVGAVASAMRSPLDEDLSVAAAWTLQSVATRLAEAPQSVSLRTTPLPCLLEEFHIGQQDTHTHTQTPV